MAKQNSQRKYIKIRGASEHNLKNIDVNVPVGEKQKFYQTISKEMIPKVVGYAVKILMEILK